MLSIDLLRVVDIVPAGTNTNPPRSSFFKGGSYVQLLKKFLGQDVSGDSYLTC
jgi:hypothetical protein